MHGIDPQIVVIPGDGGAIVRDPGLPEQGGIVEPDEDVAAGGDPSDKVDIIARPAPPFDAQHGGLSRYNAFDAGRLVQIILLCDREAGVDAVPFVGDRGAVASGPGHDRVPGLRREATAHDRKRLDFD